MTGRYSVIAFDLGNTIIRFDHHISAEKISSLFRIDSKRAYELFFDSEITRAFDRGGISSREFHKRITNSLGIKLPYKDFISIWNDIFWEDRESCDIVRRLKPDYRLFLISNVNRLHFEYIEKKFDIIKCFDEIILSYIIGAMKPDKVIFEDMIRRAGGDRTRLLYIDDREDLVKEAELLGIDSIRYEGTDKLIEELGKKAVI